MRIESIAHQMPFKDAHLHIVPEPSHEDDIIIHHHGHEGAVDVDADRWVIAIEAPQEAHLRRARGDFRESMITKQRHLGEEQVCLPTPIDRQAASVQSERDDRHAQRHRRACAHHQLAVGMEVIF